MKSNKIYSKAMMVLALAVSAMTTACSDWDDHYASNSMVEGNANASLWANIQSNPDLSQFADLLQKTGYDSILNAPTTYTVWAPINGAEGFDYEALMNAKNDVVVKQFIQNHIARNNYPASGTIDENIFMLNRKKMHFAGSANYTIGDVTVAQANVPSLNGTMHVINGELPYLQNLYEVFDSTSSKYDIKEVSKYVRFYDDHHFLPGLSAIGPTVDGQITYFDSVFYETNTLLADYYAMVNREDSNFTMIVPTDKAWKTQYEIMEPAFNLVTNLKYVPDMTEAKKDTVIVFNNAPMLKDSLIKYAMLENAFFNNNLNYNKPLSKLTPGAAFTADSLMSTAHNVFYKEDAAEMFGPNDIMEQKSNGNVWIVDSLRAKSWMTWNRAIMIQGEDASGRLVIDGSASTVSMKVKDVRDNSVDRMYHNYTYAQISPLVPNGKLSAYYEIPNVLSTEYAIYAVIVPPTINKNDHIDPETLHPNKIDTYIYYAKDESTMAPTSEQRQLRGALNDTSCVSMVCLNKTGKTFAYNGANYDYFKFPVCYYGTGRHPYIELRMTGTSRSNDLVLRLDCILLVPKDLNEYMLKHPDYKLPYDYFNNYD